MTGIRSGWHTWGMSSLSQRWQRAEAFPTSANSLPMGKPPRLFTCPRAAIAPRRKELPLPVCHRDTCRPGGAGDGHTHSGCGRNGAVSSRCPGAACSAAGAWLTATAFQEGSAQNSCGKAFGRGCSLTASMASRNRLGWRRSLRSPSLSPTHPLRARRPRRSVPHPQVSGAPQPVSLCPSQRGGLLPPPPPRWRSDDRTTPTILSANRRRRAPPAAANGGAGRGGWFGGRAVMAGAGGGALRELLGRCGFLRALGAPCSTAEVKGGMDIPSLPSAPLPLGLHCAPGPPQHQCPIPSAAHCPGLLPFLWPWCCAGGSAGVGLGPKPS